MNFDNHTIYVFVRNDLPLEQQFVQALHAAWHGGNEFMENVEGVPYMILIGLKNIGSLRKVEKLLNDNFLPYRGFSDTDVDPTGDYTAIVTAPLLPEQKSVLAKYRLWLPKKGE